MRSIKELIQDGYTWEEAEDILWDQVEQIRDAQKDRQLEEKINNQQSDQK